MQCFRVQKRTEKKIRANDLNWTVIKTACDIESHQNRILQLIEDLNSGYLTILNECLPFNGGSSWSMVGGRKLNRLWRYTLHYHGWLVELAHGYNAHHQFECEKLIVKYLTDWIETCTLGHRGFNYFPWNSYAIATRLDNWRQLIAILPDRFWKKNLDLKNNFEKSFKLQTQYLYDHLEWDLRGNHLLRDALGLINGSSLIDGSMKSRVEAKAISMTLFQMEEQILRDGSHFELSPMYHIEFMRDLIKILKITTDEKLRKKIFSSLENMWKYIRWLEHPDGKLPQFNDGSLMSLDLLREQMEIAGIQLYCDEIKGARFFRGSGLMTLHCNHMVVFLDAGQVGPDYQPGHAHADSLTLEMSIHGKRLFVDPGTYSYGLDDKRIYDRGTGSHNTIEIDDKDSSDLWHIFRVGRRASPFDAKIFEDEKVVTFEASHNGYRFLHGSPIHKRMVRWYKDENRLLIYDEIGGFGKHLLRGGWTLAPGWNCKQFSSGWKLEQAGTNLSVNVGHLPGMKRFNRCVSLHPDFGIEYKTQRLEWMLNTDLPVSLETYIDFN